MIQPTPPRRFDGFTDEDFEFVRSQPEFPLVTKPRCANDLDHATRDVEALAEEGEEGEASSLAPIAYWELFEQELEVSKLPLVGPTPRPRPALAIQQALAGEFPRLTPDEERAIGLTEVPIRLTWGYWPPRQLALYFWRYRDGQGFDFLVIHIPKLGVLERFELEETGAAWDSRFPRYQVKLRTLFQRIPVLEGFLLWGKSRVLDSINYKKNPKAVILLNRLIQAVTYPMVDIYYDRAAGDEAVNVDHANQCASDDRATNQRRVTSREHNHLHRSRVEALRQMASKGERWNYL